MNTIFEVVNIEKDKFYWRNSSYCTNIKRRCSVCNMIRGSDEHPCSPGTVWEKTSHPEWKEYPNLAENIRSRIY